MLGLEDDVPILLHIHNEPALLGSLFEGFDKLAATGRLDVVGVLAFSVGVMDNQSQAGARIINRGVLQHGVITITVSAANYRSAADKLMDADRLAGPIVNEHII